MTLDDLNQLTDKQAKAVLEACCVSERWIDGMLKSRPFHTEDAVFQSAHALWSGLQREDFLQAFRGHPKIGDVHSLQAKYAATQDMAAKEQQGVARADAQTVLRLAQANTDYEARFGYIFIVCATGKSAEEMLSILLQRLNNHPDTELHIAANEQAKITQLRLAKLLQHPS